MLKYFLIGFLALVFVGSAFCADRTVTVSGDGVVTATPDVVYINLGVVTDADTVSNSMAANKKAMENVYKSLKDAKIEDKDVCTTNFQLNPRYKYVKDEDAKLVGYSVSNDVIITIRNLDKAGDILEALAKDGLANRVSSVTYDVLDKEKLFNDAGFAAVQAAKTKASHMAKAAGTGLGKVLSITESSRYSPRAYSIQSRESGVPLSKGDRQFKVTVNVVLELKD